MPKKKLPSSERRLLRQAEGKIKQAKKNKDLLSHYRKEARSSININVSKKARNQKDPNSILGMSLTWCHETKSDIEGFWKWGLPRQWSDEEWAATISPNLSELERLTWGEILAQTSGGHKKHHFQEISSICSEARRRWGNHLDYNQYDDQFFRFRFGSSIRLWGIKQKEKFFIVWWDPGHNIYPTEPKNT